MEKVSRYRCQGIVFYILLTFAVRLSSGNQDEKVLVFGFQEDMWAPPRDDVFARFNLSLKGESRYTTKASICYRVKFNTFNQLEVHMSMAETDENNNAMILARRQEHFMLNYNNIEVYQQTSDYLLPIVLHQWTHLCHIFFDSKYIVYLDGVKTLDHVTDPKTFYIALNNSVVLGQEQDSVSGGFDVNQILRGRLTQVNIWDRVLDEEEIKSIASCKSNLKGNILSSDVDDFEVINAATYTSSLGPFCEKDPVRLIFPEVLSLTQAKEMCHHAGSEVFAPRNIEQSKKLHEESLQFTKICNPNAHLWLGLTDEAEEGIWRTFIDNAIVNETYFASAEPNGGEEENCAKMYRLSGKWVDEECTMILKACVPCEDVKGRPLRLRGLCDNKEFETFYEVLGYTNGKPYFHGYYGNMIYRNSDGIWELKDTRANQTKANILQQTENSYPLGHHKWKLTSSVCNIPEESVIELSLTACTSSEFSCTNGQCISNDKRCNDEDDCSDLSDEENCATLDVPKGYRSHKSPNDISGKKGVDMKSIVHISRLTEVNDLKKAVIIEIIVVIMWEDQRLEYKNLKDIDVWNILTKDEIRQIWTPKTDFPNAHEGSMTLQKEELYIRKTNKPKKPDFNAVKMDVVYPGTSATIVQRQHFSGGFSCSFDMFRYPFDTQICYILVQARSRAEFMRFIEASLAEHDEMQMPQYVLDDTSITILRQTKGSTTYSLLQVELKLTRRWMTVVLAIYFPSVMLLIIGYATLFLKVELLQSRLVVSLTTLLVLYTLFSNTSDNLPVTAYVKMIDIWFFSCIFFLFFIIILHVYVDFINIEDSIRRVSPAENQKDEIGITLSNNYLQPRSWTPQVVLIVARRFLFPGLIVIFSICYLTVMFSKE